MRISIDNVQTILSIIGEEDSIGFDHDADVQNAIEVIQTKIQAKLDSRELSLNDILIDFT